MYCARIMSSLNRAPGRALRRHCALIMFSINEDLACIAGPSAFITPLGAWSIFSSRAHNAFIK